MPTCTAPDPCRPVREYGCTWCCSRGLPRYHREGLDAEYTPHIWRQSKHGPSERSPTPNEVLERIAKEQ